MSSNANVVKGSKPEQTLQPIAEIFRKYFSRYQKEHAVSKEQRQAAYAIMGCRTPAMGGIIKACPECKHLEFHWKSCKNRHCPTCGSFEKAQWLEAQKRWLLPIHYFHAVFTIDHVFNPLIRHNQKLLYDILIAAAVQLLKEYGEKYLGGELGFTLVLHTWGQTIQEHPHLHVMITGGALVKTSNGYRWQVAAQDFLFPVEALSKDFQQRFCQAVRLAWQDGKLDTQDGALDVADMLTQAESKDWEVYIQAPRYEVKNLLEYLGRYVFRIAIGNHRIVSFENGQVTFKYFDNQDHGKQKEMTLPALEFIHRFLSHVLPTGFVRIRHFGLHHSSCKEKLQHARALLGLHGEQPPIQKLKLIEWVMKVLKTEQDPRLCPTCGKANMIPLREFGPMSGWRFNLVALVNWFIQWKLATVT